MITIRKLQREDWPVYLPSINRLVTQQSEGHRELIDINDLRYACSNIWFTIRIAVDLDKEPAQHLAGLGSVFIQKNLVRCIAEIHDVVVDENYRRQGIGEGLVRSLIFEVKEFSRKSNRKVKLFLTSRPDRIAANALYTKLGFVLVAKADGEWGTNLYKMNIKPE